MSFDTLLLENRNSIATITLDRASSGNRMTEKMALEIREACQQVEQDDSVRVVVVTARGDAFCLGTETSETGSAPLQAEKLPSLAASGHLAAISKPLIGALNGDAVDQGLELALACDIRIASDAARLGLTQIKDGLIPWDGGTQRLPRLVGRGQAMHMVLTGCLLSACQALQIGLVNQTEPTAAETLSKAWQVAATIAGHGPIAARYLKEAVHGGLEVTLGQGLRLEADLGLLLQSTEDRAEGIRSFLERRPPEFRGR